MALSAPSGYSLTRPWRALAKRGLLGLSFWLLLILVLCLMLFSGFSALRETDSNILHLAIMGGMAGFAATALGASLGLVLRNVASRTQDVMLGFAAGMMLAAASFSLILPGVEAAQAVTGNRLVSAAVVVVGIALGVALMLGLDRFIPHEHEVSGRRGPEVERINRVWLFVLAITIHNLPEGMAIGVSFAQGDMSVGLPLSTAIALQDIPEGLAIALALKAIGISTFRAVLVAIGSGVMEPIGSVIGLGVSSAFAVGYPLSMGLAAGAMIFVVSHEVIPETHRNGHETPATLGLMLGFALMMFLDTALG